MSRVPMSGTPSDVAAGGVIDDLRRQVLTFDVQAPAAGKFGYKRLPVSGRVIGIFGHRRTKGADGGPTACRVLLNGATIQAADLSFAVADGDAVVKSAALATDHARYDADAKAIDVNSGDVLELEVTGVEGNGVKGLNVSVDLLV